MRSAAFCVKEDATAESGIVARRQAQKPFSTHLSNLSNLNN
ncbi:hypothetical protein UNSWDHB_1878 [Dehalobacter sp. UNSWDHB]|nr:hypothetical protein UNSWDHB_1878 [Dehalobacter sp. UNSWDHB]